MGSSLEIKRHGSVSPTAVETTSGAKKSASKTDVSTPAPAPEKSRALNPSGPTARKPHISLRQQLSSLAMRGKFISARTQQLKDEKKEWETERAGMLAQIATLEESSTEMAGQKSALQSRVSALEKKEQKLETKILAMEKSLVDVDRVREGLEAEIAAMKKMAIRRATVDLFTLESFASSLGDYHNGEGIRADQDEKLYEQIIGEVKFDIPEAAEPGDLMFMAADCMISERKDGSVKFALAEMNAQSFQCTSMGPEPMFENFMQAYYDTGEGWAKSFQPKNADDPLIILVSAYAEKSTDIPDRLVGAKKVAAGVGPDCECIPAETAFFRQQQEAEKKTKCEQEGRPYKAGEFWPPKKAVIVGGHATFLNHFQEKGGKETGTKRSVEFAGLEVTHVVSDRLAYLVHEKFHMDPLPFKYCNITMPEGNDKGQTFDRQEEFNQLPAARGMTCGFEEPQFHGSISLPDPDHLPTEKDYGELAALFKKACIEASEKDERENGRSGDLVLKSSGTAIGTGVTLIEKKDLDIADEIFLQHIIPEIKKSPVPNPKLGFPFAIQSYHKAHIVDGKVPELRIVPHIVEFEGKRYITAAPFIIKTGPLPKGEATHYPISVNGKTRLVEHLWKSNVGIAEKNLTPEMRARPDFLKQLIQAGCNLNILERQYGISREMLMQACQYVAGFTQYMLAENIKIRNEQRRLELEAEKAQGPSLMESTSPPAIMV